MTTSQHASIPFWSPQLFRAPWMRRALVALLVGGALLRAAMRLTQIDLASPELWEFDDIAINLIETGVMSFREPGVPTAFMPPAFPLLLAGFYQVLGVGTAAHLAVATLLWLCDLALCFLVGWLGHRLFGPRAGFLALALAVVWPNFLIMSGRLHDISLYTILLVGAFCVLLQEYRPAFQRALLCGALMGVFALFRFEALIFLAPFGYYLAFHTPETRIPLSEGWGKRIALVATLSAVFLVPLAPWLVRTHVHFGQPMLSTVGGYNLLRGHHENATGAGRDPWPSNQGTVVPSSPEIDALTFQDPHDEVRRDRWYRDYAINYILTHPMDELRLAAMKVFYFTVADFTHPYARLLPVWLPSLIALAVGLTWWLRTGVRVPEQQVLWMLFGLQFLLVIAFFVLPRYRQMADFVPLVFFAGWLAQGNLGRRFTGWLWTPSAEVAANSRPVARRV